MYARGSSRAATLYSRTTNRIGVRHRYLVPKRAAEKRHQEENDEAKR